MYIAKMCVLCLCTVCNSYKFIDEMDADGYGEAYIAANSFGSFKIRLDMTWKISETHCSTKRTWAIFFYSRSKFSVLRMNKCVRAEIV